MKPQLALVRYTSDKKRDVVNVREISQFHPKTVNDFDSKKVYQVHCSVVRRSESDQHDEHFSEPYPATILLLAATRQSMLAAAKSKREKLPSGYAERVKRELKKLNNSEEKLEKRKSTKELKNALRRSDQERMKDIIITNLEHEKKTEDYSEVPTTELVAVDNSNEESQLGNSNIPLSQSHDESLDVKANFSADPETEVNSTLPLEVVECVEETNCGDQEENSNTINSCLVKELSLPKLVGIENKFSPDSHGDHTDSLKAFKGSGQQYTTELFPSLSSYGKPSDSNFQPRDLFDSKKARKSEEDTETDSMSCSYQSSSSIIKELESKIVSLQLSNQSLKKRNEFLTKSLTSAYHIMLQESEEIQKILTLHGAKHIMMEQETPTRATNKSWTVAYSPSKNIASPKLRTPTKIRPSPQSSPMSTSKTSSTQKRAHKSDLEENLFSKRSKFSFHDNTGNSSSQSSLMITNSVEQTPQKTCGKSNGLLGLSSSKKRSPSKSPLPSKKSETPSKMKKQKNKSKSENTLNPGEVKAEVLSNDLLKVLKKEREVQMNENRSKVCIGNNTWIKKGVWKDKFSKTSTNLKKLVNELAEEVWGLAGCGNLSLTGGISPKTPGAAQKPPAPAGKVEAIFGLCRAHLMWQGMTNPDHLNQSLTQCRLYLRNMFNESARKLKREENRAKHSTEKKDED
ncbi:BEN domain-containing protein 5 [Frankliniella fusca]|uniref:BEN domain-containing protein 5 n=1 Tax=Frankliniella fusca TaxID=407009 RepID=A0AAE1I739_9NEOP|nr:BEN domain-containing protein 5 [Frankliniella fusca]